MISCNPVFFLCIDLDACRPTKTVYSESRTWIQQFREKYRFPVSDTAALAINFPLRLKFIASDNQRHDTFLDREPPECSDNRKTNKYLCT